MHMSYREKDFFLLPYYDVILSGWTIIFILYYGKHAFINIYIYREKKQLFIVTTLRKQRLEVLEHTKVRTLRSVFK